MWECVIPQFKLIKCVCVCVCTCVRALMCVLTSYKDTDAPHWRWLAHIELKVLFNPIRLKNFPYLFYIMNNYITWINEVIAHSFKWATIIPLPHYFLGCQYTVMCKFLLGNLSNFFQKWSLSNRYTPFLVWLICNLFNAVRDLCGATCLSPQDGAC